MQMGNHIEVPTSGNAMESRKGGGKGSRGTIFDTILVLVRVLYCPNGDCGWMPQEEALSQIPGLFPRRGDKRCRNGGLECK